MAKDISALFSVRPGYLIRRGAIQCASGLSTRNVATAIFDSAALDSAGAANSAVGTHGLGVYIPTGAIITRAYFQTKTGFTSAGSTATVAFKAQTAADLFAATLVSNGALSAASLNDGIADGTAAHMIALTAERELSATVAVQALTAGKAVLLVEYVQGL